MFPRGIEKFQPVKEKLKQISLRASVMLTANPPNGDMYFLSLFFVMITFHFL